MSESSVVLFRNSRETEEELAVCKKHFDVTESRTYVGEKLVIGRYSVLPFYKELENDLLSQRSRLVNTFKQHRYIADLQNWYYTLEDLTPKTWFDISAIPDIPVILKGETNSKKFLWNTHMYAKNKKEAIQTYTKLLDDSFISSQNIYAREYVPLIQLAEGTHGLPITVEYRFFVYGTKILSSGFYWSNYYDDVKDKLVSFDLAKASSLVEEAAKRITECNGDCFFVVDVGLTTENKWIIIELNDGQMSGLSENDPNILYCNLKEAIG